MAEGQVPAIVTYLVHCALFACRRERMCLPSAFSGRMHLLPCRLQVGDAAFC